MPVYWIIGSVVATAAIVRLAMNAQAKLENKIDSVARMVGETSREFHEMKTRFGVLVKEHSECPSCSDRGGSREES